MPPDQQFLELVQNIVVDALDGLGQDPVIKQKLKTTEKEIQILCGGSEYEYPLRTVGMMNDAFHSHHHHALLPSLPAIGFV